MELPRALKPWSESLDLFPRELAMALGPIVRRLDLLIGPLRTQGQHGTGDPDGYDGLSRRGSYDRLLISEWLLAEEVPDEFVRRVAMDEQAFLRIARREPVGARVSVALFDAGPNQMGAPRIAHLAALIVLARRAAAAGACFSWGLLHDFLGELRTEVTAHTVRQLLAERTAHEITEVDVAAWRVRVGSEIGADDLWIVGGRRLASLPATRGASLLQVADPLDPETHSLRATVRDRGHAKPEATLDLPDDATCVRLLRDPFRVTVAEPQPLSHRYASPTSPLTFTGNGTRLMARLGTNSIVVYVVPSYPAANVAKPKIYQSAKNSPILAAAQIGRSVALVTLNVEASEKTDAMRDVIRALEGKEGAGANQSILTLERAGPRGQFPTGDFLWPYEGRLRPPEPTDPLGTCHLLEGNSSGNLWMICLCNMLASVCLEENKTTVTREMDRLRAFGAPYNGLSFFGWRDHPAEGVSDWVWLGIDPNGGRHIKRLLPCVESHFGREYYQEGPFGMLAISNMPGEWTVHYQNGEKRLDLSIREPDVVGVVMVDATPESSEYDYQPGLVVLHSDRRRLSVVGQGWGRDLIRASSEIKHITVSPYGPELAYLTVRGELIIYSLSYGEVLSRLETEGAS